jgi:carbamoyl-phosphate synthase large subunit
MNVLVSGVGAIIGYGIVHSLREGLPTARVVGTDIYHDAVGQGWCDAFEQAPLTTHPAYLDWLSGIVDKHRIDLIIPGFEQDIYKLSDARDELTNRGVRAALNSPELTKLCGDKWEMHEALKELNDPSRIPSKLTGDFHELAEEFGLPFILKPRRSYASKGLVRVTSKTDYASHAAMLGEQLMAQPIIGTDDEEYTVGIFGDGAGNSTASIQLKRTLSSDGSTAKARVRDDADIQMTVQRLVAAFRPTGPTNLQLRRCRDGIKLLEINPRISSSTSIRRAFGYNESVMCVDYFMNGRLPAQPTIRPGFAARFIEDYIVYDRDNF